VHLVAVAAGDRLPQRRGGQPGRTLGLQRDLASAVQVAQAVAALREEGPALGRPLADRIQGSRIPSPQGAAARSEIRVLFAFDPTRSALLPLGGDNAGNWKRWYKENIPIAEQLYLDHTRQAEE